jgi:hypothetical protein
MDILRFSTLMCQSVFLKKTKFGSFYGFVLHKGFILLVIMPTFKKFAKNGLTFVLHKGISQELKK